MRRYSQEPQFRGMLSPCFSGSSSLAGRFRQGKRNHGNGSLINSPHWLFLLVRPDWPSSVVAAGEVIGEKRRLLHISCQLAPSSRVEAKNIQVLWVSFAQALASLLWAERKAYQFMALINIAFNVSENWDKDYALLNNTRQCSVGIYRAAPLEHSPEPKVHLGLNPI